MALLTMSQKELDRYSILKKILMRELTGVQAAELLRLSTRQIKRLKKRIKQYGARGLIHQNRGRAGNRAMSPQEQNRIKELLERHYVDFGPTLAAEKLRERHGIARDPKTIRRFMTSQGLWQGRRRKTTAHRTWRARKEHPGELVQFDGSYEFWFEDRGARACLLAAIDDATGRILHAQFADHEGVLPVFGFWKGYMERLGKPRAIYLDKFSTYKQNLSEDPDLKTQFQRALRQLGVEPIFANSPQAKGRVERLFKTLQDRLIKELRLQHISTPEAANRFLEKTFLPDFNRRFGVHPASAVDLHRALRSDERKNLAAVFSRQEERVVRGDFTVSLKNDWYQILPTPRILVRPKETVVMEERLGDSLHIRIRNAYLNFEKLPARPQHRQMPWVAAALPEKDSWKPPVNHPWRRLPLTVSAPAR